VRDYLTLGATPSGEPCAPLGSEEYTRVSRIECAVWRRQLERFDPRLGPMLSVRSFQHDFGTYREVVVSFDDSDVEQVEVAYHAEGDAPEFWDEESRADLQRAGVASLSNSGPSPASDPL
jgi:hypothetical protein